MVTITLFGTMNDDGDGDGGGDDTAGDDGDDEELRGRLTQNNLMATLMLVVLVVIAADRHAEPSRWSHRSIINPRPQPKSILETSHSKRQVVVKIFPCCPDNL